MAARFGISRIPEELQAAKRKTVCIQATPSRPLCLPAAAKKVRRNSESVAAWNFYLRNRKSDLRVHAQETRCHVCPVFVASGQEIRAQQS